MAKMIINAPEAPAAVGPYEQGYVHNGIFYSSGQIPINPATGAIEAVTITEQAEQVCKNLGAVLEANGLTFTDAVKTTCFLADMGDFAAFNEVYAKAKQLNPELPDGIQMFMSEDEEPNAFATGRKTVCFTRGLFNCYNDEQIKGVLSHEFGHLAHKDTDTILVVSVGNLIITTIFTIVRVIANIMMFMGEFFTAVFSRSWGGVIASIFIGLGRVIADFILVWLMRLWNQLGVWLCMHSSRKNEYRADQYAYQCGYAYALCEVLDSFGTEKSAQGIFAALASSHPENLDRIENLNGLMTGALEVQ